MIRPYIAVVIAVFVLTMPSLGADRIQARMDELQRENAALSVEEARLQAEIEALEAALDAFDEESKALLDIAQTRANAEQLRLWLNMEGRSGAEIVKIQIDSIVEAIKGATVPRPAAPLSIRRNKAAAVDVTSLRGSTVVLAFGLAQDPALDAYLQALETPFVSGMRGALVLLDDSRGPPHTASRLDKTTVLVGNVDTRQLRSFLQQQRVYSGTFVLIDAQGRVRYQGPLSTSMVAPLEQDLRAKAAPPRAPPATPPQPSTAELAGLCHKSYHEAAVAGNHLSTWDSSETRTWCDCIASNIRNVLAPQELSEYTQNPVAFIRKVLDDPTPSRPRNWRLFTPITNCWQ